METPDYACTCPCLMKVDLQKESDKLAFLKDNWYSFDQTVNIDTFSKKDLQCSYCLLSALIDDLANDRFACPNRDIIRLVMVRMYVQNTLVLYDLRAELEQLHSTL